MPARPFIVAIAVSACAGEDEDREAACRALDAVWTLDSIPETAGACEAPPPRDLGGEAKLAVAVYHFNVQYVAGGLRGFPDGEIVDKFNLGEAQVEDRIIRQGLEPVLDLFLANERWKADIELQAYAVELIALRHPDVLEKMRALAGRGQIDFDSFHYSDQLYVAYPTEDLEASLDLTSEIFRRTCLPLGRSIFTQEGQFAAGQLPIAKRRGYAVSVLPKNLFEYQVGSGRAEVLYEDPSAAGHVILLGGRGFQTDGFELRWTFMDDGEIAFSKASLNPYFGTDYEVDPAQIAAHAEALAALEAEGFVHATIAEAAEAMVARGIRPARLPPIFDGTWQPRDTNNVFRWMGGSGLFRTTEKDSDVLARVWRARSIVADADRRFSAPAGRIRRGLSAAWREAFLAEVSDSTGWNPFVNEVRYGETHAAEGERIAEAVIGCAGLAPLQRAEPSCHPEGALPDLGAAVETTRSVDVAVERCDDFWGAEVRRLSIGISALAESEKLLDDSEAQSKERELEVAFESAAAVEILPALRAETVTYALADYAFESIGVPLPMGLISAGERRWIVQDQWTGRVAAILSPSDRRVRFIDLTVSRAASSNRRFYVVDGADAATAVAFARRINAP